MGAAWDLSDGDNQPVGRECPRSVVLVGHPNVGKSLVFGHLTGRYAVVSNYPGTTVEVSTGPANLAGTTVEVQDTPGMYSLLPITDEERVGRRILLTQDVDTVVHVVDAKCLERMLPLTLQLLEMRLPTLVVVNMMDEAEALGIQVDTAALSSMLGVPVVASVATSKLGLARVRGAIAQGGGRPSGESPLRYRHDLEKAATEIEALLPPRFASRARGISLLLLQEDLELLELVRAENGAAADAIAAIVERVAGQGASTFEVTTTRHARAAELVSRCVRVPSRPRRSLADVLNHLAIEPLTGVPLVLAILYFGLYQFVGVFGAGDVVDFLENKLFGNHLNPYVNSLLLELMPRADGWHYWVRELIGSEYGIITLGVTYAMAIVLPIVFLFFTFFSVLEDTGYFPRLALLVDRVFKRIGLNGRAVIPIVLGFGCATMATMVTRIQETRRERFITTLLLALAIPCSAQYGLVTGLLASHPAGILGMSYPFLAWAGIMVFAFVGAGVLASRLVPGQSAAFYMELPPLRLPRITNIITKTLARMKWYFMEVLPLFVLASVLIWVGRLTGLFDLIIAGLVPVVGALGLPAEAAPSFLFGFFRRDFGAAGLFNLAQTGKLAGAQLLVSAVTLTLFLPCVAQLLIMKKERGLKATVAMALGILVTAFGVGAMVHVVLDWTGWMS